MTGPLPQAGEGDAPVPAAPEPRAASCKLLSLVRLVGILAATLGFMVPYLLIRPFVRSRRKRLAITSAFTHRWARVCCWTAGYTRHVEGPMPPPGCFLAPNHLGYADILVLAAAAPTFFLAKAEVASWPLFGWCAAWFENVFASRRRSKDVMRTREALRERLEHGFRMCAFLEGTSSGGKEILPFRPAFLQPALDVGCPVVPTALHWSSTDSGVDVGEDIAYWGDHVFFPHLWRHLGLRGVHVTVRYGEPVRPPEEASRKELAAALREKVVQLHAEAGEAAAQRAGA
jgi:1-acyl-sn-glycerol-3-phosphate acyltransferase